MILNESELWRREAVHCVIVPHGHRVEVELRNADGTAFLRKSAPTRSRLFVRHIAAPDAGA